jgi:hypothetical protein
MKKSLCFGGFCAAMLYLGSLPVMAQATGQSNVPVSYECAANAHCNVACMVDGEKEFQTGSPKTITVTLLAPNNYVVEIVEQSGHSQSAYLAGTKVICNLDGVTKKVSQ